MTDPSEPRDWHDVDGQADPESFVDYLDQAIGVDAVRAYKRRSHARLELEPGDRVLDAGCGLGDDARQLAEIVGPDGAVMGLDNSEAMVEQAQENTADAPGVAVRVGDIHDIDAPADRFDASRADRVLQHLESPDAAVAELARVTRPGGRVGLTDPDWESLVIDVPGLDAAHELLDPDYAVSRHPAIGRRLYGLARRTGLVDLDVDAFVFPTTDFGFLEQMGDLETWTDALRAGGAASDDEVEAWFAHLREADEADRFFAAMAAYTVVGTVPT